MENTRRSFLKKMTAAELIALRTQYAAWYRQEQQTQALANGSPAPIGRLRVRI